MTYAFYHGSVLNSEAYNKAYYGYLYLWMHIIIMGIETYYYGAGKLATFTPRK